jgi:hypothetical protein
VFVACNVLVLLCFLQLFGLGVFVDVLCSCLFRRLLIVPGVSSLFARGSDHLNSADELMQIHSTLVG